MYMSVLFVLLFSLLFVDWTDVFNQSILFEFEFSSVFTHQVEMHFHFILGRWGGEIMQLLNKWFGFIKMLLLNLIQNRIK